MYYIISGFVQASNSFVGFKFNLLVLLQQNTHEYVIESDGEAKTTMKMMTKNEIK